ncbi:MAG TPA: hypothetical protein VNP93_11960, partial [Gaiellaceae bacterium]|nr:hypothetical protein [Gaiellaceae bacterium]
MNADLVLTRGAVFATGGPETVAVQGGRVAAVGSARDAREWIGPGTRVLELEGRTVLPGFQDAHLHP